MACNATDQAKIGKTEKYIILAKTNAKDKLKFEIITTKTAGFFYT